MKLIKFFMVLIAITGLSIMFSAEARATTNANIYYDVSGGDGLWTYNFTFENTSTAGESLYKVFLDFDEPLTATGSDLPSDWVGIWEGTYTTYFLGAMSVNRATYIDAKSSLDEFSFTVNQQIGNIGWYAEFMDASNNLSNKTGTTTTSSALPVVPEPVSTILFITGGVVMAARERFRRK